MDALFIPNENDFKRWIKESIQEYLEGSIAQTSLAIEKKDPLLNRVEIAKVLRISLATLIDWMKRGCLVTNKEDGCILCDQRYLII